MKTAHYGGTKVLMAGKRIGLDLTARWYHALSPTISTRPACSLSVRPLRQGRSVGHATQRPCCIVPRKDRGASSGASVWRKGSTASATFKRPNRIAESIGLHDWRVRCSAAVGIHTSASRIRSFSLLTTTSRVASTMLLMATSLLIPWPMITFPFTPSTGRPP